MAPSPTHISTVNFWFPWLVRKGTYKFTLVRLCVRSYVRSGSTALTVQYFFSIFFAWRCVSIWLRWPPIFFGSNFFLTPKMVNIWPFLAKIVFLAISFKRCYKLSEFLVWKLPLWSFLRKSLCTYMLGKFWEGKIWPFVANFRPKLTVLKVFGLLLPNAAMNLPNFWYGSYFCRPL